MLEVFVPLGLAYLVTFIIEAIVEYAVGQPFDRFEKLKPYKWLLVYVAAGAGIGLALFYKIDIVAVGAKYLSNAAKIETSIVCDYTAVGAVLTGLLMGRGSNYLHQFVQKFFPKK